ncbi:CoA transferase [Primorskyibacter flagellatus]|uniref:CoA transferase n=1 Tax=Primorskyibacter flagellatus TaxID=1387277 RepID=A0A917AE04_9RHOB|nr:CoA transferase [Primorskyibacter flagellatus]GGE46069.1 CoA transferase [Primorskyibacter flagellatus]
MTGRPLEGIRVADFCWIGAGSYTTKILSDMGAEVIKIESNAQLDSLRVAPPFKDGIKGVDRSGYFADRNSSKKSLTINMKHPDAREAILRLIRKSDLVTNNFTPGVMERFGLGYEELKAVNPKIIWMGMSMQGQEGPEKSYLGYGLTIGALTGLHWVSGLPGKEPAGTGTNYPDHIPNPCHAAFAALAALRHVRRTGQGQKIDVAQTEPMIAMLGPEVTAANLRGNRPPQGNRQRDVAPHGVYPVAGEDRWLAIVVRDDREWAALCEVLGVPEEGRFRTADQRMTHRDALDDAIAAHTRDRDGYDLMAALQGRGVACGVVQTAADVTDRDEQLRHRNHWQRMVTEGVGEMLYNAPPYRFSRSPSTLRGPAPKLGEHTAEIATDLLELDEDVVRDQSEGRLLY